MTRRVVVTGIGVVLPDTQTVDDLWANQQNDRSCIRTLSKHIRGSAIDEAALAGNIAPRLSKKLDSFTRYSLIATRRALDDAGVDIATADKERCGVFVGNCFGGWKFTEVELRHLHCEGPRAVSPFQATSWFPAAPQGQITIFYGIKGFSKTYMADRASSLISVASAANLIRQGKLDLAIAGGTESTNTDFIKAALASIVAYDAEPAWPLPVTADTYGFLVSEGAVFLILEDGERAARRNARVYAEIGGFGMRNGPCAPDQYTDDPKPLIRSMNAALGHDVPDLVLPDACGLRSADSAEAAAIEEIGRHVPAVVPKMKYGHSFGAEGALDIAFACLMLRKQQLVPSRYEPSSPVPDRGAGTAHKNLRHILINGRSMGGAVSSLVISKGEM